MIKTLVEKEAKYQVIELVPCKVQIPMNPKRFKNVEDYQLILHPESHFRTDSVTGTYGPKLRY